MRLKPSGLVTLFIGWTKLIFIVAFLKLERYNEMIDVCVFMNLTLSFYGLQCFSTLLSFLVCWALYVL